MVQVLTAALANREDTALQAMFAARKEVFVDLLKWNLPVAAGRFEIDQFDDDYARYIILLDRCGKHLASARLLPTTRPHILSELFEALCDGVVPQDVDTFEITRFCIDRSLSAAARLRARNHLITALVEHALDQGITRYTAVTDLSFLQQIVEFGWECRPLGMPNKSQSGMIGALEIRISGDTPSQLTATGVWSPPSPHPCSTQCAVFAKG